MPHSLNNFSITEIQILEHGLRRITQEQERFAKKFYHRLLQDHNALNSFLRSMNTEDFCQCLIRSLESIIREFRTYGEMITPPKNYWPEFSTVKRPYLEISETIRVTEIFLALVSEVAENAWSPPLESTWRKAINAVIHDWCEPMKNSSTVFTGRSSPSIEKGFIRRTSCAGTWSGASSRSLEKFSILGNATNSAYFNLGKNY